MKFYFISVTNKLYHPNRPGVLCKPGITTKYDVLERYHPKYDSRYNDWTFNPDFSVFTNYAAEWEQYFLNEVFPYDYTQNKIWLEDLFDDVDRYHYNKLSGISEFRLLPNSERKDILAILYKLKKIKAFEFTPDQFFNL